MIPLRPAYPYSQLPHHVTAKSVDGALSRQRDQMHLAGLARFEAHGGAGRDIEPHAAGFLAIEFQRRIGLEEMIVRADLDRAVTGIGDRERYRLAAGIELDVAVLDEEFAGDHFISFNLWIPGLSLRDIPERLASPDRLVHGDKLGAVRARRFDLNVMDHLGDAIHHLRAGAHPRPGLHQ